MTIEDGLAMVRQLKPPPVRFRMGRFGEIGIEVAAQTQDDLPSASETQSPTELHQERYRRYKG
jgi:hypothetical protein